MSTQAPVTEGQRVAAGKEGFRATVRYVGPVEGQEGQWAGLEWDDATRGPSSGWRQDSNVKACCGRAAWRATSGRLLDVGSELSRGNCPVVQRAAWWTPTAR
mmetsp:Transcript_18099/g.46364  ORF Transcript_18099/g.46364 Transcript_18099/m.46364 type:complete len:102 (+) Transcript_18099:101-406(+)